MRRFTAVLLVLATLACAGLAHADGKDDVADFTVVFIGPTVAAVGVATVIGNLTTIGRGERGGYGLALAGVVVAGLEFGLSALTFARAEHLFGGGGSPGPPLTAAAVFHGVWGLLNGALAIWAWTRPLARSRVSLAPMPIVAIDGSLAPGVGLSIGRF